MTKHLPPTVTDKQVQMQILHTKLGSHGMESTESFDSSNYMEVQTDGECHDNRVSSWETQAGWGLCIRTCNMTDFTAWTTN